MHQMALINILNIKVPLGNRIYSRKFTFYHLTGVNLVSHLLSVLSFLAHKRPYSNHNFEKIFDIS